MIQKYHWELNPPNTVGKSKEGCDDYHCGLKGQIDLTSEDPVISFFRAVLWERVRPICRDGIVGRLSMDEVWIYFYLFLLAIFSIPTTIYALYCIGYSIRAIRQSPIFASRVPERIEMLEVE